MASLLELARMSAAVYDPMPSVTGWGLMGFRPASGDFDGFQAAVFIRGSEIVVAFRGTAQCEDAAVDLALGVGMNPIRFAAGERFARQFEGRRNVTVTGHSLGGAMAQVAANRLGFVLASFNAPGVAVFASRNLAPDNPLEAIASVHATTVRTIGMVGSVVLQPKQAWSDVRHAFRRVEGVNLCLANDLISRIGNHYGRVVRIEGTNRQPVEQHRIGTIIQVLEQPQNCSLASRAPSTF
jgi:hypothetical protein